MCFIPCTVVKTLILFCFIPQGLHLRGGHRRTPEVGLSPKDIFNQNHLWIVLRSIETHLFHGVVQLREGVDGGQPTVLPHLVADIV